jgi:hypothetical protein
MTLLKLSGQPPVDVGVFPGSCIGAPSFVSIAGSNYFFLRVVGGMFDGRCLGKESDLLFAMPCDISNFKLHLVASPYDAISSRYGGLCVKAPP